MICFCLHCNIALFIQPDGCKTNKSWLSSYSPPTRHPIAYHLLLPSYSPSYALRNTYASPTPDVPSYAPPMPYALSYAPSYAPQTSPPKLNAPPTLNTSVRPTPD